VVLPLWSGEREREREREGRRPGDLDRDLDFLRVSSCTFLRFGLGEREEPRAAAAGPGAGEPERERLRAAGELIAARRKECVRMHAHPALSTADDFWFGLDSKAADQNQIQKVETVVDEDEKARIMVSKYRYNIVVLPAICILYDDFCVPTLPIRNVHARFLFLLN
jgi:hypothetical protein